MNAPSRLLTLALATVALAILISPVGNASSPHPDPLRIDPRPEASLDSSVQRRHAGDLSDVASRTALANQGCGISGRLFDGSYSAAHVELILWDVDLSSGIEDARESIVTNAAGEFVFSPVLSLEADHALYVVYRNPRETPADNGRLSAFYGHYITVLDPDGCANAGDIDIANIELDAPLHGSSISWGRMFSWSKRIVAATIGSENYQVCLEDATVPDPELFCLPEDGVSGTSYGPSAAERPAEILDDTEYFWYVKVLLPNGSYGYSNLQRSITFFPVTPVVGTWTPTVPTPTPTATIVPPPGTTLVCPGETYTGTITAHIDPRPKRADVLLSFDATGSMATPIAVSRAGARTIMSSLERSIPDINFGVQYFRDYSPGTDTYVLQQPITNSRTDIQSALGKIVAGWGAVPPEAYARALYESIERPAPGSRAIGWRSGARHFIVMFGDQVPIDNDLNEGIALPLSGGGAAWCNAPPSDCIKDPGRDGISGTADDIDFQAVLDQLAVKQKTLLFASAVSDEHWGTYWRPKHLAYWTDWTARVGSGSAAVDVHDSSTLVANIVAAVDDASRRVSGLVLETDPVRYNSWLESTPTAYPPFLVPPGGDDYSFSYLLHVLSEPEGSTHDIRLVVRGGGAEYASQVIRIHVASGCPAPPAPNPPGDLAINIPVVSYRAFSDVFDGPNASSRRIGPASGPADSGIQIQNLNGRLTADAYAYFYQQRIPYMRPPDAPSPPEIYVEAFGIPPSASTNLYLQRLDLPFDLFSVKLQEAIDLPVAAVARTDWRGSGAATLYTNVESDFELNIPIVLRNFFDQTSIIAVMSTGNRRRVTGELLFRRSGESTPASDPVDFTLQPNEGMTFDLRDNVHQFNELGDGFTGSASLRLFYGPRRTDTGALIGAISMVNMASSGQGVWAFEAVPSGDADKRGRDQLYVPLWRSGQIGPEPDFVRYDTGIAVSNPNDEDVDVTIEFRTTNDVSASAACREMDKPFSSPTVRILARSNHIFYQGIGGGDFYPPDCFGSAVVRSASGAPIHAIVVDTEDIDVRAAAYSAMPRVRAHTRVAIPLFRNLHTKFELTTGIQVMNVGDEPAEVFIHFWDGLGNASKAIEYCGEPCRALIQPLEAHTWWPPSIKVDDVPKIPSDTLGSARIESDQPVIVIVNDYPRAGGRDSATYNGIPVLREESPIAP